jgi:hypothetical protein
MKIRIKCLALVFLVFACNDDNEFSPDNLEGFLSISIENDNASADGVQEINIIARFPGDFSTEADGMVDFEVFKDNTEISSESIVLVQENGIQKKQAVLRVKHNKAETLRIKATINVNDILISEDIYITYSKAFLNEMNITSSSLTIMPSTFNEISITTELLRDSGIVSLNSEAETTVVDTLGQLRGIFNNYKNKTDAQGKILNKYTLGSDDYVGRLHVIATSFNENNETKTDTLTIFSQN